MPPEGARGLRAGHRRRRAGSAPRSPRALAAEGWPVASTTAPTPRAPRRVVAEIEATAAGRVAVPGRRRRRRRRRRRSSTRVEERARARARAGQQRRRARRRPRAAARRRGSGARCIDTNLSAAFHTTRRALGPMLRARFGRIVNVASVVGPRANAGQANYAASKAGLIGMTKTVAVEVARRGITVNAVAPGLVETQADRGHRQRPRASDPRPPARHPGGGRRLRPLPRLRGGRVRDRHGADRRRRTQRLNSNQTATKGANRWQPK